jgi:hypothetical protein
LKSGFANKQPLILMRAQIDEQMSRGEGNPARTANVAKNWIWGV